MTNFISVPFTADEVAFIREAFPNRATVEAIKLGALAEAGRRMKEITDAEKLLRDYRSLAPFEPAPAKVLPPAREATRPLPITPKRNGEIEKAAQALRAKLDSEDETRRRQRWDDLGPEAFKNTARKQ